ncbi:GtrA family protein [Aquipseudomonas alcaligenes]|uniref:GtrA-like protein n=1 Tax=Aquipseudomonas alcaligenes TaxID=43263 RepID=A0A1N6N5K4_AQUAC|nr:GtrA family protein [Pseudomonas alcaligenes]SIP87301.1 GtrA-like protein [Pseudomonas alcaligenes]
MGVSWAGNTRQVVVFLLVGLLTAAVDIGAMQVLIGFGAHYAYAVSAGFILGLVVNYFGHAMWTFEVRHSLASALEFLVVVLINYGLTMVCVALSMHLLDMALPGKLLSLPVVAANGYLLTKYWVFR